MTEGQIRIVSDDGSVVFFEREKLLDSLRSLSFDFESKEYVDVNVIVDKICLGLPNQLTKSELVDLSAETVGAMVTIHPDHSLLASRILTKNLQSKLPKKFSDNIIRLRNSKNSSFKRAQPLISDELYEVTMKHKEVLDDVLDPNRDFELTYFGYKTLERSYLLKVGGQVAETPQYMLMRVALGIFGNDIRNAIKTYNLMSQRYYIHGSPTLFNAGTPSPYLSSCFLLAMEEDSIDGIYKTLHKSALISKAAGGIGLHVHNIRACGSYIAGSNGTSSGLVPMLRVFNNTARYVDQGGNKRPGAFAIYLEPWHADIFQFLDLKKNHGKEDFRARDLFYALWIPDLFMEKVEKDEDWCLFSPDEAPGLSDTYGDDFVKLYHKYESEKRHFRKVKAQKLWYAILEVQTETGNPFMLYKDACNKKSNQKNLGVIKSSNLCCEIVEYSSPEEVAVCNLASLALPRFIKSDSTCKWYDFNELHEVTKMVVNTLDKVIDVGKYPVPEAEYSNKKNRPIAIGVQGLADTFMELRLPFDSQEAKSLNIQIFETIYHGAVEASVELAKVKGKYASYEGSPISKGLLQFDLWDHKPSDFWDWDTLKHQISEYGVRNSLLVAPMPTASTSQILGYNECFEPTTSNIYSRRVLSGEFQIINKHLLSDLIDLGLWNNDMKNLLLAENGSIQNIPNIPEDIKKLYKTAWEISQKVIIELAADRAPFIDQSQSMNLYLKNPTMGKLTSMHFYSWKKGLKTGMYYLRTQAASSAIQFTVDAESLKQKEVLSISNGNSSSFRIE
ncbi:hypothetical protein PACTADRAFT_76636 [Pachysolen tannophilus NRRL Y-2460]|uniref:Ribonucleoside-diphosphate reductase n=1 Tax=Pachysolen tannophilus NRRL Y-2460 TaxID=669874 RepID=A0A1E4TTH8_PACTA|nr:hypothetical protein PACTADRAFT_76636 [Pachysolen tannophilus NRRL Y-2460]